MNLPQPSLKTIATTAVACIGLLLVGNYILNKFFNVMLQKLVPFIQRWEGGLSRDPNDSAAKAPAPWTYNGKNGWHTNKGITFATFQTHASRLGYKITPENFFLMPDALWLRILKHGYMAQWNLDRIAHLPRIQAVIITWSWGSGVGGATTRLSRFLKDETGIDPKNSRTDIIERLKNKINPLNELEWFHKLCDRRLADYKKMPTWGVHGKGWTRRLNDFRKTFGG